MTNCYAIGKSSLFLTLRKISVTKLVNFCLVLPFFLYYFVTEATFVADFPAHGSDILEVINYDNSNIDVNKNNNNNNDNGDCFFSFIVNNLKICGVKNNEAEFYSPNIREYVSTRMLKECITLHGLNEKNCKLLVTSFHEKYNNTFRGDVLYHTYFWGFFNCFISLDEACVVTGSEYLKGKPLFDPLMREYTCQRFQNTWPKLCAKTLYTARIKKLQEMNKKIETGECIFSYGNNTCFIDYTTFFANLNYNYMHHNELFVKYVCQYYNKVWKVNDNSFQCLTILKMYKENTVVNKAIEKRRNSTILFWNKCKLRLNSECILFHAEYENMAELFNPSLATKSCIIMNEDINSPMCNRIHYYIDEQRKLKRKELKTSTFQLRNNSAKYIYQKKNVFILGDSVSRYIFKGYANMTHCVELDWADGILQPRADKYDTTNKLKSALSSGCYASGISTNDDGIIYHNTTLGFLHLFGNTKNGPYLYGYHGSPRQPFISSPQRICKGLQLYKNRMGPPSSIIYMATAWWDEQFILYNDAGKNELCYGPEDLFKPMLKNMLNMTTFDMPNVTIYKYKRNLIARIRDVQHCKPVSANIYLATILKNEPCYRRINVVNAVIKEVADELNISLIDLNSFIWNGTKTSVSGVNVSTDHSSLFRDNMHPNMNLSIHISKILLNL